ncbi:unnamed protein product [Ectocarpus sp. CCAP 1310/34]|nr:unnamed protein product [Ectocarpus sp. CCAP 1310/34]
MVILCFMRNRKTVSTRCCSHEDPTSYHIGLRMMAGASYLHVAVLFGVSKETVFSILWQATCDANYRFCSMSCIAPGSTNDWTAWNHSDLSTAVKNLPPGFYMLGDAAYPLSDHLLTPYPGRGLPLDKDAFNFYLSQLRVRIEQAFGILVGQWGILWKPLRVQFAGRCDLITALFRLHNFLRDEKVTPIHRSEEDAEVVQVRPHLLGDKTLPGTFSTTTKTTEDAQKPTRSGEVSTRKGITMMLDNKRQYRPKHNLVRNAARKTEGVERGRAAVEGGWVPRTYGMDDG